MPKTGTSAIQASFAQNRVGLRAQGFCYPDLDHVQHLPVVRTVAGHAGSPAGFPQRGAHLSFDELKLRLQSEAADQALVLSSEFFFDYAGLIPNRSQATIGQSLALLGQTIDATIELLDGFSPQVIVWLRRQDHWLEGMYNNRVKVGHFTGDFEPWRQQVVAVHIRPIVQLWLDRLGAAAIHLGSYDQVMLGGSDIIDATCEKVGIDRAGFVSDDSSPRTENPSLTRDALELKLRLNHIVAADAWPARRALEDAAFALASEQRQSGASLPRLVPNTTRKVLMQDFIDDNIALTATFPDADLGAFADLGDLDDEDVGWGGVSEETMAYFQGDLLARLDRVEDDAAVSSLREHVRKLEANQR